MAYTLHLKLLKMQAQQLFYFAYTHSKGFTAKLNNGAFLPLLCVWLRLFEFQNDTCTVIILSISVKFCY